MKLSKLSIVIVALFAFAFFAAPNTNAQLGGITGKAKSKVKDAENKTKPAQKAENNDSSNQTNADDDSDARAENAKKLAKAAGDCARAAFSLKTKHAIAGNKNIKLRIIFSSKNCQSTFPFYLLNQREKNLSVREIAV